MSELFEAARAFYNATIADTAVIIRTPSAEKQAAVTAAADRLRTAWQAARATPADHISQARDAEYRALLGLQSSVEESVRNGLMDVSVEQSLATVQATQSASPEAAPK